MGKEDKLGREGFVRELFLFSLFFSLLWRDVFPPKLLWNVNLRGERELPNGAVAGYRIGDGDDERGKQLREWRRVGVWCVFGGFELMWMFVVSALLRSNCLLG